MQILIDIPDEKYEKFHTQLINNTLDTESRLFIMEGRKVEDVLSKSDIIEKIKYGINDKACFGSPLIDWAVIKFIKGLPSIGNVKEESNDSE